MSIPNQSTAATLRRRAKTLLEDGYNEAFLRPILRAAEELDVFESSQRDDAEQLAIEAVADNRRLRQAIARAGAAILGKKTATQVLAILAAGVQSAPEPGKGRSILSISIGTEDTAANVITRSYEAILGYFAQREAGHGNSKPGDEDAGTRTSVSDEDQQREADSSKGAEGPHAVEGGAGRDLDQHPSHAEGNGGAAEAGVGARSAGPQAGEGRRTPVECWPTYSRCELCGEQFRGDDRHALAVRHLIDAHGVNRYTEDPATCRHKFVDSKHCLKCGWSPIDKVPESYCRLGCSDVCKADLHGCPSECVALGHRAEMKRRHAEADK